MKPDDFLIRTTIRIETQTKNGFATGTGFFYEFFLPSKYLRKYLLSILFFFTLTLQLYYIFVTKSIFL